MSKFWPYVVALFTICSPEIDLFELFPTGENVVAIAQSLKSSEGKKRRRFTSKSSGRRDSSRAKSSSGVVSTHHETWHALHSKQKLLLQLNWRPFWPFALHWRCWCRKFHQIQKNQFSWFLINNSFSQRSSCYLKLNQQNEEEALLHFLPEIMDSICKSTRERMDKGELLHNYREKRRKREIQCAPINFDVMFFGRKIHRYRGLLNRSDRDSVD